MVKAGELDQRPLPDPEEERLAWEGFLEEMVGSGDFDWSEEFLMDLLGRLKTGTLSAGQKQAVRNIAAKRGEWWERTEGLP